MGTAFKMKVDANKLAGPEPAPPGIYEFRFITFRPKWSEKKDSYNLNPQFEIVDPREDIGGKMFFWNANSKNPYWIQDMVHAMGQVMEIDENGEASIPGAFNGEPEIFNEEDMSTYRYVGPLTGKTGKVELTVEPGYQGKPPKNSPVQWFCRVDECAVKFPKIQHSTHIGKR